MKTTPTPAERLRQDGVRVRLKNGRRVLMWRGRQNGQDVVIVKPLGKR